MSQSLPETMTAIEIREPGGPEVLVPAERPLPQPAATGYMDVDVTALVAGWTAAPTSNFGMILIGTSGDFFFWVPGNVAEFGVKIYGSGVERVNAAVFDPAGKQVWSKEDIDIPQLYEGKPRTPGEGEVWRVRIGRPTEGAFEDCHIDLRGVPCVLGYTAEALLKPTPEETERGGCSD